LLLFLLLLLLLLLLLVIIIIIIFIIFIQYSLQLAFYTVLTVLQKKNSSHLENIQNDIKFLLTENLNISLLHSLLEDVQRGTLAPPLTSAAGFYHAGNSYK
jgi:hypothetical protein